MSVGLAKHLIHIIDSFLPADNGTVFRCEAWNDIETVLIHEETSDQKTPPAAMGEVTVDVKRAQLDPIRVAFGPKHLLIDGTQNDSLVAREGEKVTLKCSALKSHPPATVQWGPKEAVYGSTFKVLKVCKISFSQFSQRMRIKQIWLLSFGIFGWSFFLLW